MSPNVDWGFWSRPAFMPLMQAKVHFGSGVKTYTPDDIESIDFEIFAKNNSSELFGEPVPGTGSMTLIDYDQTLNPTRNTQLKQGTKVELFLGFRGYYKPSQLGPNLVTDIKAQMQVEYRGAEVWAIPFKIKSKLDRTKYYRLAFNYVSDDGELLEEERTGMFDDLFYVPEEWPDNTALALTYSHRMSVSSLSICICSDHYEPYGVFYAQEWTYDSAENTCTVDLADSMSELLTLDNRIDALKPSKNVRARTFLFTLLNLFSSVNSNVLDTVLLQYSFYEATQIKTLTDLLVALRAQMFFMPDGSLTVSDYNGYYNTGVVFDDDNVYSYSLQQTATKANNAAIVSAFIPTIVSNQSLATFNALTVADGDIIPFDKARVYSVDYLKSIDLGIMLYQFTWSVLNVMFTKVGNLGAIITFDPTYGWEWIQEGAYKSMNDAHSSSTAYMYIDFTTDGTKTLAWEWSNSSEITYDYITATCTTGSVTSISVNNKSKGNEALAFENLDWEPKSYSLPAGTHRLTFAFSKDSSVNKGLDAGFVRNITLNGAALTSTGNETVGINGTIVDANEFTVCNSESALPYEVKDNHYIQTTAQAQQLVNILDKSFNQDYRVIELNFRGGYGFWVGAKVRIESVRYGIFADYVIVGIKFNYSGIIDTTLTLQRVC